MNNNPLDFHGPGVVRMYSGTLVDVTDPSPDTLLLSDIAWNLGRMLRYNGAIKYDWTVAHHSLVMSYYVPEGYRLEALLHDAGEAYFGDTIYPIKALVPEIGALENSLTGSIMRALGAATTEGPYEKSPVVALADQKMYQHECFQFGDRPGVYQAGIQRAWLKAIDNSHDLWHAPYYPFVYRYYELTQPGKPIEEINEELEAAWHGPREVDKKVEEDAVFERMIDAMVEVPLDLTEENNNENEPSGDAPATHDAATARNTTTLN